MYSEMIVFKDHFFDVKYANDPTTYLFRVPTRLNTRRVKQFFLLKLRFNINMLVSSSAAKNAFFASGKIFSVLCMAIFGRIPDFKDNFLIGDFRNLADTI